MIKISSISSDEKLWLILNILLMSGYSIFIYFIFWALSAEAKLLFWSSLQRDISFYRPDRTARIYIQTRDIYSIIY